MQGSGFSVQGKGVRESNGVCALTEEIENMSLMDSIVYFVGGGGGRRGKGGAGETAAEEGSSFILG